MKEQLKVQLEQLIRTVKETQLVERLIAAKDVDERVKICEEEKKTHEFQAFMKCCQKFYDAWPNIIGSWLSTEEFHCKEENVTEVALILIIGGISEGDIFDYEGSIYFEKMLLRVTNGPGRQLAEYLWLEGDSLSTWNCETWMRMIF